LRLWPGGQRSVLNERYAKMSDTVDSLILDLLEWIGPNTRPYSEVIEAWRTSCPRLPVWEEATERGFVVSHYEPGSETVSVTARGVEYLRTQRQVGIAG
jgi:D-3-phosphoglycerate dehydrogenase